MSINLVATSENPALSIVVPFCDTDLYINECLESLRLQQFTDIEVICVAYGSLANSQTFVQEYAERDSRFRVIRQEVAAGVGPARNAGMSQSRGKYVTFVDASDVVAVRSYALAIQTLEESCSDFVTTNAMSFSHAKQPIQSSALRNTHQQDRRRITIHDLPELVHDRAVTNKIYRKSFLDKVGVLFPATRYADYPVSFPAYLAAANIDVISYPAYYRRIRETNDPIAWRSGELDILRDRIESAHLTLNEAAVGLCSEEVRSRLHGVLLDTDLVVLVEALAHASPEIREHLESLAVDFARHLDPAGYPYVSHLVQFMHKALVSGNTQYARELSRYRIAGTRPQLLGKALKAGHMREMPALMQETGSRLIRPSPRDQPTAKLLKAQWAPEGVQLDIEIARPTGRREPRAKLQVVLAGSKDVVTLAVRRDPNRPSFRWQVQLSWLQLKQLEKGVGYGLWVNQISLLRSDAVQVSMCPGEGPEAAWVDGNALAVVAVEEQNRQTATLQIVENAYTCCVTAVGGRWRLKLKPTPPEGSRLLLRNPHDQGGAEIDLDGAMVELAPFDLVNGDVVDDPVTRIGRRLLVVEHAEAAAKASTRDESRHELRPVYPGCVFGLAARRGTEQLSLASGGSGQLVLRWSTQAQREDSGR